MAEHKIDPRIIRTRKLIMESFSQLLFKKEFKDITIMDITSEATVNRATFYYHFTDKYDLLDLVLTEGMMTKVLNDINEYEELNEKTIITIFLSVTKFQTDLAAQCRRNFEAFSSTIERKLKESLEKTFYRLLRHSINNLEEESLRIGSVMLSWAIYGASIDWQDNSDRSAEDYIQLALPHITKTIIVSK